MAQFANDLSALSPVQGLIHGLHEDFPVIVLRNILANFSAQK